MKSLIFFISIISIISIKAQNFTNNNNFSKNEQQNYADSIFRISSKTIISNTDTSLILLKTAYSLYLELQNNRGQMRCLSQTALAYDNNGKTDTAIILIYKAIDIGLQHSYDTLLSQAYLRLGNMYKEIGDYTKATEFYKKTIKKGFPNTTNGAWGSLGIIYSNINKYDSAKIYLEKSLLFFNSQDTSNKSILFNISSIYGSLGINCFDRKKPKEGIEYFKKSLIIAKKIGNKNNIISNLLNFSIAYDMAGFPKKAEAVLHEAKRIANKVNNEKLSARVNLLLSDHYYEIKDYKLAYEYLETYHNVIDSLKKVEYKNTISENEIKYLKQIQEVEVKRLEIEKEKDSIIFLIIISVSIIVFITVTVYLYKKVKLKSKEKELIKKEARNLSKELGNAQNKLEEIDKHLTKQNILILELQKENNDSQSTKDVKINEELANMKILVNEDWDKYMDTFNILFPNFLNSIISKYPNLTEGDKRQLIMLKLKYSRKKSASILGISPDSIKRAQQRLSKKLGLKDVTEFDKFINDIN